jgi:selenocysteine lyase/cysteine desulfurase
MYAPYGTGALVGRRDTFLRGDPDTVGGGTVDIVTVDEVQWAGLPDREEAGSPNVVGAVALAKALRCLQQMGMEAVAEHEAHLTADLLRKLASLDQVQVYGIADPGRVSEKVGVVPINVAGLSHYLVAAILSAEGGIGVRNGCFCAHPYLLELMEVSAREAKDHREQIRVGNRAELPGLVRVSFGCYNNEAEIDHLVELLNRIVRGEYQGRYVQDPASGAFWPEGYVVDWDAYFSL